MPEPDVWGERELGAAAELGMGAAFGAAAGALGHTDGAPRRRVARDARAGADLGVGVRDRTRRCGFGPLRRDGFSAGAGSGVSTRADFSSSPRIYQQWRPVPRSMRKYQCWPCGVSFFGSVRQSAACAACWGRAVHAAPATHTDEKGRREFRWYARHTHLRLRYATDLRTDCNSKSRQRVGSQWAANPERFRLNSGLGSVPEKPIFAIGWHSLA